MKCTSLAGRSILILEDEPLIAFDIEQAFETAGASIVAARTVVQAMSEIEKQQFAGAVVDFALADGDASAFCTRLHEQNVPFLVHSGLSGSHHPCAGAVIGKPARPENIVEVMASLLNGGADGN